MTNLENNSDLNIWLSWLQNGGVYRSSLGYFYLYKKNDIFCKSSENSIVYMNFYEHEPIFSQLSFFAKLNPADFTDTLTKLKAHFKIKEEENKLQIPFMDLSPTDFEFSYKEITSKIFRGEIEKAVPIVAVNAKHFFSKIDLLKTLSHLTACSENLYPYGFWNEHIGVVGCSPEILFNKYENQIVSMAIAGTLPKDQVLNRIPLMKDPKELREHKIVVQDIIDRLSKYGTPQVENTKTVELPTLFHLATKISVVCNANPIEVMKHLHPTGALGIIPRNFGISWLKQLSFQSERSVFGAPIMFSHPDFGHQAVVAIRNLMWHGDKTTIHAGCGLVKDSVFENEFKELNAKIQSVKTILGVC